MFHSGLVNKSSTFFTAFCGLRYLWLHAFNCGVDPDVPLRVSMEENLAET